MTTDTDHTTFICLCAMLGAYWLDTLELQSGCSPEGSFHCRKLIQSNCLVDPVVPVDLEGQEGREDL